METKDTTSKVEEQAQSKLIVSKNQIKNVKSHYIILKIIEYMTERKSLETIKYNKSIQKRIDINIKHYKAYSETKTSIELDIIPMKGKYGKFIKLDIIIIDYQIKSFSELFYYCKCIESIKFKKFSK